MFVLGLACLIFLGFGWPGVVPAGAQVEVPPPVDLPVAIMPAPLAVEKKAGAPSPRSSFSGASNTLRNQTPPAKSQQLSQKESPKQIKVTRKSPRTLTLAKAEGQMRTKSINRQGKTDRLPGRLVKKGNSRSGSGGRQ